MATKVGGGEGTRWLAGAREIVRGGMGVWGAAV